MTTELLWQELEDKQAERVVGGWQQVQGAKITGLGSNTATDSTTGGINQITIDNKNHDVTTATASGERGTFSWSSNEIANAFDVASLAYRDNKSVTLIYSEYELSPHADFDTDNLKPFYLLGIVIE